MAWKKVVQLVALSTCPKCGNHGFDPEPGQNLENPHALVKCGACGHVCEAQQIMREVNPVVNPK